MGTTPQTGAPEWDSAQASPWLTANKARRTFDAFALRTSVIDRDLTAPPSTCSDGARYLIAATATGDWATHDGQLAIAFGTNASNGWVFATAANEGVQIWIEDEETQIEYVNGAWVLSPDQIRFFGDLADVDLTGLNDGDQVYYDASNAQWFPAPPLAGSQPAGGTIGQVLTKQSNTDGDVFWDDAAAGVTLLSELSDVDVGGGLNDGDQLLWDSSNAQWYPAAVAAGGGGGAWELAASWTHSSDVPFVDFTDLGGYSSLLVIFRLCSLASAQTLRVRVSVDNGTSFYATSGNYIDITGNTGTEANNVAFSITAVTATAGRSGTLHLYGTNISGAPKLGAALGHVSANVIQKLFVGSTNPINAIRCSGGTSDTINFTGGSIYVLGIPV